MIYRKNSKSLEDKRNGLFKTFKKYENELVFRN